MTSLEKRSTRWWGVAASGLLAIAAAACGVDSGKETDEIGLGADTALPAREGSVVVDGCVQDTWTRSTLASPATKRVLGTVIMLCLVPREDGTVGPRDESALAALATLASELKSEGYRFHLGVAFTDESGQRYDGQQTSNLLANPAWRRRFVETLPEVIESADGVELDLQQLPNGARPSVTALVQELAPVVRPRRQLAVFVPPSVTSPSDLPGGDAISRVDLAPHVDRMRIMTLDFSEDSPGPTIDPGWAVDAARLAKSDFPNVDVAYPLYGTDFGPRGRRPVTYHEARAISAIAGAPIERGPTGAPFLRYVAFGGEQHELWFDDAESTGRALGAWSYDVLPPDVGILFYGLGAEDPALFERLSARLP
jgi:spore germination protein YaaH